MIKRNKWTCLIAMLLMWAFLLGVGAAPNPVQALDLGGSIGDLVKIFGIAWVVDHFSGQINKAINSALAQHDAAVEGYTKVVPIIRFGGGKGTAVGAAQVMGPREQVEKVKAVGEAELNLLGAVRARALLPISTRKSLTIVPGVGVSANIKFPV
jgi:hypothetical protein